MDILCISLLLLYNTSPKSSSLQHHPCISSWSVEKNSRHGMIWFSAQDLTTLKSRCYLDCFLIQSLWGKIHFHSHWGYWQNPAPWESRTNWSTSFLAGCQLSWGHSQLLQAAHMEFKATDQWGMSGRYTAAEWCPLEFWS